MLGYENTSIPNGIHCPNTNVFSALNFYVFESNDTYSLIQARDGDDGKKYRE